MSDLTSPPAPRFDTEVVEKDPLDDSTREDSPYRSHSGDGGLGGLTTTSDNAHTTTAASTTVVPTYNRHDRQTDYTTNNTTATATAATAEKEHGEGDDDDDFDRTPPDSDVEEEKEDREEVISKKASSSSSYFSSSNPASSRRAQPQLHFSPFAIEGDIVIPPSRAAAGEYDAHQHEEEEELPPPIITRSQMSQYLSSSGSGSTAPTESNTTKQQEHQQTTTTMTTAKARKISTSSSRSSSAKSSVAQKKENNEEQSGKKIEKPAQSHVDPFAPTLDTTGTTAATSAAEAEAEAKAARDRAFQHEVERRVQEQLRKQEEKRLAAEAKRFEERLAMEESRARQEAEAKRLAEEEEARMAELERQRILREEAEAEALRAVEQEKQRRAAEEARRIEEERAAAVAAAAEEERRKAEAEAAERERQAQEEAEAERVRLAELDTQVAAAKAAEEIAAQHQKERELQKQREKEEKRRRMKEEEERKRREEEEAAAAAAEEEAQRLLLRKQQQEKEEEEERKKRKAEEEERRERKEAEDAEVERRVQEQLRLRMVAEEEAREREAAKCRAEEAEKERQRVEEQRRKKAAEEEEEARRLKQQQQQEKEEEERRLRQEIERRIAEETEARVQAALAKAAKEREEREAEIAAREAEALRLAAEASAVVAAAANANADGKKKTHTKEKSSSNEKKSLSSSTVALGTVMTRKAKSNITPPLSDNEAEREDALSDVKKVEKKRSTAVIATATDKKAKSTTTNANNIIVTQKKKTKKKSRHQEDESATEDSDASRVEHDEESSNDLGDNSTTPSSSESPLPSSRQNNKNNKSKNSKKRGEDYDDDHDSTDSSVSFASSHDEASGSSSLSSSASNSDDEDFDSSDDSQRRKQNKKKRSASKKNDKKKDGQATAGKGVEEPMKNGKQKQQQQGASVATDNTAKNGKANKRSALITTSPSPSQRNFNARSGSSNVNSPLTFTEGGAGPDGIDDKLYYQHVNGLFDGPSDAVNTNEIAKAKAGIALAIEGVRGTNQQQAQSSSSAAPAPLPPTAGSGAPDFRTFESVLARQRGYPSVETSASAAASRQVVIENFPTIREEGRCPDAPKTDDIPHNSFMALQNNFFKAQQYVVGLPHGPFNAERFPQIPDREPTLDTLPVHGVHEPNAKSFSSFAPVYESSLVKKDVVESDEDDDGEEASDPDEHSSDDEISDEEELEEKRAERRRLRLAERAAKKARRPFAENPIEDPSDPTVVTRIGSSYLYPDPLHMWERARGKRLVPPAGQGAIPPASSSSGKGGSTSAHNSIVRSTFSTTYGPNTHRVYCNELLDINAFRRPLPAVSMFNNGFLLKISVDNIASALEKEHGAVDPLMLTFSLYTVPITNPTGRKKISEDFHVGLFLDQFFPHKSLHVYNNLRKFVVFVPEEHRGEPLALFCRVHRLACEDFSSYVDLYQRPHTYQRQKHLIPMLQETQQLAMSAVAWQELGFTFFRIAGCELKSPAAPDKIFRSTKALKTDELTEIVYNETKLKSLSAIPITISISVSDASFNEVSFPTGMVEAARELELNPTDTANSNTLAAQLSKKLPYGVPPTPQETESLLWLRDPEDVKGNKDLCRHVGSPRHVLGGGYVNAFYNLYYLRMLSAKLATVPACVKLPYTHRTIVVQVCLKASDDSFGEEGIPAFFGGPLGSGILTTSAFTTTTHSSFALDFADEFKIQLPAYLTRKHHLFFTYWAVATKKLPPATASQPQPSRMLKIGYSIAPLVEEEGSSLTVRDVFELPMISLDSASAMGGGYLYKIQEGNLKEIAVLGGNPVLTVGASTRTSVYSADPTMGSFCEKMRHTIPHIINDTGALQVSGKLPSTVAETDQLFESQMRTSTSLGKIDVVAYFPALCSFHIACIASPCQNVSLTVRRHALQGLMHVVHTMQAYDMSDNTFVLYRRVGTSPKGPVRVASSQPAARTAVANTLYTFLGNNPMFTDQKFNVAQGVAEVWYDAIVDLSSKATTRTAEEQQLYARLSDYSWFLLDLILRSLYLSSSIAPTSSSPTGAVSQQRNANDNGLNNTITVGATPPRYTHSRTHSAAMAQPVYEKAAPLDPSFYVLLEKLLIALMKKEIPVLGTTIIGRIAVFLRQATVRCDRGAILQIATRVFTSIRGVPNNVQCALRIFTEHTESYLLMMPTDEQSPTVAAFFMHTFLELLKPSLLHKQRDVRFGAAGAIYNLCVRLVNNKKASGKEIQRVATSMYGLVVYLARHWKDFTALTNEAGSDKDKTQQANIGIMDRRMVLSIVVWILFHGRMPALRGFLQSIGDGANKDLLAGFLQMLVDMQNIFRNQAAPPKSETKIMEDLMKDAAAWESRFATFIHLIGAVVAAEVLSQCTASIRCVDQRSAQNPHIYPFFLLLEAIVSVNNASVSLIAGSSTLHQTSHQLFPELISGRASYMSGMILLALRLMSFSTPTARSNAVKIITEMATLYHTMTGNMSRMRSNMANALVGVAESKGRDMTKAGIFILNGLQSVSVSLSSIEGTRAADVAPEGFMARFTDGGNTQSSNSGMKYDYHVPSLPSTDDWVRTKQVADAVLQQQLRACSGSLSEEFGHMIDSLVQLFKSVLRVQQDDAMKFKDSKCSAYHQIIASFFNQCVVTQGFKWLQRLHDTHRGNEDNVEAALTSVVSAALAFRITEIFYEVKGRDTKGARMPFAIFGHVSYSEYMHIVPELIQILPTPAVYAMVTEMSTVGSEPVFTVEGQIVILQAAASLLDKANYAELSLSVALLAAKFAIAKGDYTAGAASYTASSKLCSAIASTNVRRAQHRYYLVWARMEMEQPPIKAKKSRRSKAEEDTKAAEAAAAAAAHQLQLSGTLSGTVVNSGVVDDVYTVRKPLYLSEPIKKVVKVPYNVDRKAFEQQICQQVSTMLEDPSIVIFTEDSVDTLPFAKPKKKKGVAPGIIPSGITVHTSAAAAAAAGAMSPIAVSSAHNKGAKSPAPLLSPRNAVHPSTLSSPPTGNGLVTSPSATIGALGPAATAAALAGISLNHCWLTVKEVTPYLSPEEVQQLRPHQRICNAIDKTTFVNKFECTSLCGLNTITKVSEGLAGSLKQTKVVSQFDPMAIKKEHLIFTLMRAFPCATTSIDVATTEIQCLDAPQTAAEMIRTQTATLENDGQATSSGGGAPPSSPRSSVNLIIRIYDALTPLGIVPAGHYYKQLAVTMRDEQEVMQALTSFIIVAKKRTDEAIMTGQAMEKHPEKCANVLKAVADMECALL